jgi:hypothetical protein
MSLDDASKKLKGKYSHVIATTKNHQKVKNPGKPSEQPPCDRFRVVLLLSRPVVGEASYRKLIGRVRKDLFPTSDRQCLNPGRLFYSCTEIMVRDSSGPIEVDEMLTGSPMVNEEAGTRREISKVKGNLAKATLKFIVDGAPPGHWHEAILKASMDLCQKGYSKEEALIKLTTPTEISGNLGYLSRQDNEAIEWAYSRPYGDIATSRILSKNMNLDELHALCAPYLDENFLVYRENDGGFRTFEKSSRNEVIGQKSEEGLEESIARFLRDKTGSIPTANVIRSAIKTWRLYCDKIQTEPVPVLFRGQEGHCFRRIDDLPSEGPITAWTEFLLRISDPEFFMAFYWSVFVPENTNRRILYLTGDGQDGKSTILKVMGTPLGAACASINNTAIRNPKFLLPSICNASLVIYPDCKNSKFLMSELVRNITSGDVCTIEEKFQPIYSKEIRVRLAIASNIEPEITGQRSDTSRLAWIKVSRSQNTDDPNWERKLREQWPHFLWECKRTYDQICPHNGDIPINNRTKMLVATSSADFESLFADIFEEEFLLDPLASVTGNDLRLILRGYNIANTNHQSDFHRWLKREKGIEKDRKSGSTKYIGICKLKLPNS